MVITKKLISAGCAALIAASMCAPAMAYAAPADEANETTGSTSKSVTMNIKVEASNVDVTVPAEVDPDTPIDPGEADNIDAWVDANATTFVFKADGSTITPHLPVKNNGSVPINLYSLHINPNNYEAFGDSPWVINDWSVNPTDVYTDVDMNQFSLKAKIVNTKNAEDSVAEATVRNGVIYFGDNGVKFDSKEKKFIDWEVQRGTFSKSQSATEAFDLTLNFAKPHTES